MLRYITGSELAAYPRLRDTMFRDRAAQFQDRLGWEVQVDENGFERDRYDALNPLYVIWQRPDGSHGGSMRFLPSTGPTMIRDHFASLAPEAPKPDPRIWECTRFCLAPDAAPSVAGALMLGGGELMRGLGLTHFLGVFDARMIRIYRCIGAAPLVLGSTGQGRQQISAGLWSYDPIERLRVARRAGISTQLSQRWFERAFGSGEDFRLIA